jgi:membrane-bound inhibitor of C-type lysozyme
MNKKIHIGFVLLALIAAHVCAAQLDFPNLKVERDATVAYRCDRRGLISVRYLDTNVGSFAFVRLRGVGYLLASVAGRQDRRYVADKYEWRIGRGKALLRAMADGRNDLVVLDACRESPESGERRKADNLRQ